MFSYQPDIIPAAEAVMEHSDDKFPPTTICNLTSTAKIGLGNAIIQPDAIITVMPQSAGDTMSDASQ